MWHGRYCKHDLFVNFHPGDIANMNDVTEAPLWECEIPLSDDGY